MTLTTTPSGQLKVTYAWRQTNLEYSECTPRQILGDPRCVGGGIGPNDPFCWLDERKVLIIPTAPIAIVPAAQRHPDSGRLGRAPE